MTLNDKWKNDKGGTVKDKNGNVVSLPYTDNRQNREAAEVDEKQTKQSEKN